MLETLETAGSALTAQRLRMDVIASNLANSEATSTPDGGPYKRERVVFGPALRDSLNKLSSSSTSITNGAASGGVEVKGIVQDDTAGKVFTRWRIAGKYSFWASMPAGSGGAGALLAVVAEVAHC